MAEEQRANRRKVREGMVVSDSPDKTVVVAVTERVRHSRYAKTVQRTRKLYALQPRALQAPMAEDLGDLDADETAPHHHGVPARTRTPSATSIWPARPWSACPSRRVRRDRPQGTRRAPAGSSRDASPGPRVVNVVRAKERIVRPLAVPEEYQQVDDRKSLPPAERLEDIEGPRGFVEAGTQAVTATPVGRRVGGHLLSVRVDDEGEGGAVSPRQVIEASASHDRA